MFFSHIIDLHARRIFPGEIIVREGRIEAIREVATVPPDSGYILPGFTDAHVHVESSMMPPTEFARLAVVHGTIATVSDPHEIANVLGAAGVQFMLDDAARSPFKFCFGAPSCVPATRFETAGAALDAPAVAQLLADPRIGYLSEMMNFPGVLFEDAEVMDKIAAAKAIGKPIDGHAPGLRGDEARRYFAAGISTDHECFTLEEATEKAALGVHILLREGSAARNFEALWPLLHTHPAQVMFCSDDKHPDDLILGHINQLVARALSKGCELFDVLRAACLHPVAHYQLPVGQLRPGDPADFIRVADLKDFKVLETWINGVCVARKGESLLPHLPVETPNQFLAEPITAADLALPAPAGTHARVRVIEAYDGQIVTGSTEADLPVADGLCLPDTAQDVLKIVVLNRYTAKAKPAIGFVKGLGLEQGALASSVAHDSHNIVAVGTDDAALAAVINAIIAAKGGVGAYAGGESRVLPLPIAGLMSDLDGYALAHRYADLDAWAKTAIGCKVRAPFMLLSFLALPVIPALKMTDLGVFDVQRFGFVDLYLKA
ncbi:MAG: adenine deaminase [Chitinophagales bacterium]|nr:adenine deaminase [Chitinophagales bacterium]